MKEFWFSPGYIKTDRVGLGQVPTGVDAEGFINIYSNGGVPYFGIKYVTENSTYGTPLVSITHSTGGTGSIVRLQRARGDIASPAAVQSLDFLGRITFGGYAAAYQDVIRFDAVATEDWNAGAWGAGFKIETMGKGTTTGLKSFHFRDDGDLVLVGDYVTAGYPTLNSTKVGVGSLYAGSIYIGSVQVIDSDINIMIPQDTASLQIGDIGATSINDPIWGSVYGNVTFQPLTGDKDAVFRVMPIGTADSGVFEFYNNAHDIAGGIYSRVVLKSFSDKFTIQSVSAEGGGVYNTNLMPIQFLMGSSTVLTLDNTLSVITATTLEVDGTLDVNGNIDLGTTTGYAIRKRADSDENILHCSRSDDSWAFYLAYDGWNILKWTGIIESAYGYKVAGVQKDTVWDAKMDNPMEDEGDIIYGGASGTPTKLAKGSDDQVLKLSGGIPTWATVSFGAATLAVAQAIYSGFISSIAITTALTVAASVHA